MEEIQELQAVWADTEMVQQILEMVRNSVMYDQITKHVQECSVFVPATRRPSHLERLQH